jgi:hypothetical protein
MQSKAASSFWKSYAGLPKEIQKTAVKQYRLWLENSRHSSLQFKKVQDYWSVRVSRNYRALGIMDGETVIWFWIGPHGEYDNLIRRKR